MTDVLMNIDPKPTVRPEQPYAAGDAARGHLPLKPTARRLRPLVVFLAILASLAMAPHTGSAANRCLDTADKLLFKVKSWSDLRKWFESYADCDDGDVAEGVSDYVAVSLAQHWRDLPKLEHQIEKSDRFGAFVLRHIDSTDDLHDLAAIVDNATKRCPSHSTALCASLANAARMALEEPTEHQDILHHD
jgi:hypothetical protein